MKPIKIACDRESARHAAAVALAASLVASALLVLAGCNTTEGAGKDIKSLGSGIEQSAQDAKN